MRVLVACEFSGVVRNAFTAKGHDAWSCDLLPTESTGNHIQDDVLMHLNEGWDLMIAHPPCTYITNAGVRHLHDSVVTRKGKQCKIHGAERYGKMIEACIFFIKLFNANIPKIAVENPIPHKYAKSVIGQYHQLIQPWQFGHGETKGICLWLKNLPPLMSTLLAQGREHRAHLMSPGPDRWKERSRFYTGIAEAMALQWNGEQCP